MITFSSCRKYLDWEIIDKGRKPVVNAIFFADSVPILRLYKSKHILDNANSFEYITDASVYLYINTESYNLSYNQITNTYENNSIRLLTNQRVEIIANTSIGNVRGETIIPYNVPILFYDTLPHYDKLGNYDGTQINITFNDPKNDHNYYIFSYQSSRYIFYNINQNFPGVELIGKNLFLEDISFNGQNKTISLHVLSNSYIEMNNNNDLEFILMHVDENLYRYQLTALKQTEVSPFIEPIMVYNNISNGLGICGSASISRVVIHFQ